MKIISEGDRPFSWAIPFELLADKWRISNQLEQKSIKPRERLQINKLIDKFPNDKLVPNGKALLKKIRKAKNIIEKHQKEIEKAAQLNSVTEKEILVDAKAYRNRTFIRRMGCKNVDMTSSVYTTNIAELNIRAGKMFTARCCFDAQWFQCSNNIQLRMSRQQAKEFVKKYGSDEKVWIKAAVWFSGRTDSSDLVFYLKNFVGEE